MIPKQDRSAKLRPEHCDRAALILEYATGDMTVGHLC